MRTIARKPTVSIGQQALNVEESRNICEALVIFASVETFIVAGQARINVGRDELVICLETFRDSDFEGAIVTTRAAKAAELGCACQLFGRAFARIEKKER